MSKTQQLQTTLVAIKYMSRVSPEVSIISYLSISHTYLIFLTPSHLSRTYLISHSFFPLSFPPLTSLVPISSLSLLPLLSPSLLSSSLLSRILYLSHLSHSFLSLLYRLLIELLKY